MLHDLLAKGIDFNRAEVVETEMEFSDVDGSAVMDPRTGKQKIKSQTKDLITLNPMTDQEFYGKYQYSTFEKVTQACGEAVRDFQAKKAELDALKKTKRIQDIQEMLTKLPAYKSKEKMASKHMKLAQHLEKVFTEKNMIKLIPIQQGICRPGTKTPKDELKQDILGVISETANNPGSFHPLAGLKLVLLYAIRFENDKSGINQLKQALMQKQKLEAKSVNLVDTLIETMGSSKRVGDVFANNSSVWKALMGSRAGLVLTQPYVVDVLKRLCLEKLPESEYKWSGQKPSKSNFSPDDIIVFFVGGGTTYTEMAAVHRVNENANDAKEFRNKSVILGGHTVMRSLNFLSYLDQLAS